MKSGCRVWRPAEPDPMGQQGAQITGQYFLSAKTRNRPHAKPEPKPFETGGQRAFIAKIFDPMGW